MEAPARQVMAVAEVVDVIAVVEEELLEVVVTLATSWHG